MTSSKVFCEKTPQNRCRLLLTMMSSSSDPTTATTSFSLCLTTTSGNAAAGSSSAGGKQQRQIISISSSASVHEVYQAAQHAFGDNTHDIAALRYGFPPKLLDKDNITSPIHAFLSNHERILVEFAATTTSAPSGNKKKAATSKKGSEQANNESTPLPNNTEATDSNVTTTSPTRKTSQRAAAKAATEGFAAVIQAQDKLLAQQTKGSKKNKSNKRPRSATAPKSNTNKSASPGSSSSQKSSPIRSNARYFQHAELDVGRRLGDGAAIAEHTSTRVPSAAATTRTGAHSKRQETKGATWKSEEDVSTALMSALNQSGGGGKVGGILRKAMRNAVSQSYEASRAVVRVAAMTGKAYTMTTVLHTSTAAPSTTIDEARQPEKLQVTYDKGVEGRGQIEETVDYIPKDALVAVITAIYQSNPEALRPARLAQLSPRVFWSLVYHTNHVNNENVAATTTTATTTDTLSSPSFSSATSVEEALHLLLPELDWSYMKNRKRTLSEKAQENLRQQLERDKAAASAAAGDKDEEENDHEDTEESIQRAQETILAVQNAMETIHDWDSQQRRNRMAQAAMARLVALEPDSTNMEGHAVNQWSLVTPTEPDDEELVACVKPTAASLLFAEQLDHDDDDDKVDAKIQTIVRALMNDCQIHNWRELANASAPNVVERLNTVLPCSGGDAAPITTQAVEAWIDHAQEESVDEIMVEVCDGQVEVVEQLRDAAHSGTPKDLAGWRHVPQMLWSEAGLDQTAPAGVTVETLATWCQRAHQVLLEREWLQWYATPIIE